MRSTITLVTAAVCLAACSRETPRTRPATPVRVTAAQPVEAPRGHRYSATLEPRARVAVAFRSSGYVQEIARVADGPRGRRLLQAGDRVARGAELAHVKQEDTAARVAQARAALAEAVAAAERSRLDASRAESLFASASLTRPDLDAARAGTLMGSARVEAAAAQLAAAEVALADTRLLAPLSGVILSRGIEEGALVGPGSLGFVLADTDTMKAMFGVPDVVVQTLRIGEQIPVVAEGVPGVAFAGHVTALSPSADPTSRVFDVEVTIPNPDGRLKSGMVAAVEVGSRKSLEGVAPAVPLWAILKSPRGEGYAVYVVEETAGKTVARARDVVLGGIAGNQVAVLEGLTKGESVVVTGAALLTDGEAVRVIP